MDYSVTIQAMPEACSLLHSISSKEYPVELLGSIDFYMGLHRPDAGSNTFIPEFDTPGSRFYDAVAKLVATHPGVQSRVCHLGFCYEWLQWLIARSSAVEAEAISRTAIEGEAMLLPLAVGADEFSIYWTTPVTCRQIASMLSTIEYSQLLTRRNRVAIHDADLYGWNRISDTAAKFAELEKSFHCLKSLYLDVSQYVEGVLVVKKAWRTRR